MTLAVILTYLGLPLEDLPLAKDMTVTWIARAGLMAPEVEPRAAQLEVQFQKYLQTHFERVRREPDGSLLSTIVNTDVPEWGRVLTDEELHGFVTTDMLVGGAETTTGGLAAGARMLAERPELFESLAADPSRIDTFVEEVVRLESPVAGMFRQAAIDVEFHGVTVPAGSVLQLRYASANRDERQYTDPERLDLQRPTARRHVAFGTGNHVCLGATLARREMWHTFAAVTSRFDSLRLAAPEEPLRYRPNYVVRCLDRLDLEFTLRPGA
jgi:cytochrome P450